MVRKDLLNHLLLLGSKRNFFSEYPIVSASTTIPPYRKFLGVGFLFYLKTIRYGYLF